MVKINIVCVGKIKEDYFASGVQEYIKRLNRFAKVSVIEVKEKNIVQDPSQGEILEILKREGEEIKKHLSGHVIAMAIEGEKVSSESFSKKLKNIKDKQGEITFIIGSSCGLSNKVKQKADYLLSFSDMTFPHQLMRVILTEQVYRAFMINAGSTYHK